MTMKPPLSILCATDLSPAGDHAVRAAHALAEAFGSRLIFVHAVPYSAPLRVLFPHLVEGTTEKVLAMSRVAAATAGKRIVELTGRASDSIDVRVDVGPPDEVIVEAAEESKADLLVIGAVGADASGPRLGATVVRVARHAHCPVFVARESPTTGPIIAATDLSDHSTRALSMAAMLSAKSGDPLVTVHVVDFSPVVVIPDAFGPGVPIPISPEEHQAILNAATEKLSKVVKDLALQGTQEVDEGLPAEEIVLAAKERGAKLVVVGAEGGSGIKRMLLGSVAEDVAHDAPCSVLLMRPYGSADRK